MYVQARRNTCNMLRSLKQKQRKVWTSSHKIYQAKMFCWRSISNVTKLCPLFAGCTGSKRFVWMCHSPPLPYLHILLIYLYNTNCLEPGESCLMQAICSALWHFALQRLCYNIVLRSATKPVFGSLVESNMRNEPLHRQSAT